ncbi:hypothetical protein HD806DRAFT_518169 [Xylariaceae sp. AK1471]|nr:hypothetical protein HD806DRAFT_518169 [Xylariaceae sp. AK1471]
MSFGFSVGDFLTVIELVNKVRKDFAGAPDQFQHISNELRCLDHAIRDIDVLLFGQDLTQAQEKRLCDITDNCRLILEDTLRTLNGYSTLKSRGDGISGKAKRVWKRLQWEPDDIRELRSRIALSITYLNSFIEGFNLDNVVRLVKGQDRLVERQNQQEQQEILDWLTPINYSAQQSDFIRRRQAGTGQWLLDSPEYQHWVATKKGALFCPGIPGAGKTILTSIVVDNLLDLYRADNSVGICYIFLNFRRKDEQKLDDLMASLLKQLAHNRPALPSGSVKLLHDRHKKTRTRPSFDELCQALCSVISEYSRVFVVIDALDECQIADNCRSNFISELLNLSSGLEVNVFATSRGIPEITSRFIVGGAGVREIRASDHDIVRYVDGNLSHLPGFVSRDINLQIEIKQSIVQCVDGMFLLAQLHLDSLRGKPSRKAVRTALSKLAKGSAGAYDIAYDDAMARITGQLLDQKDLALQTLSWITSAKRPLTTEELRHALGVELNETEFDEDNLSDLQDIVSSCCGLVTIDEQNDIIRLVHYTTQEYFDRTRTLWFPFAESEVAKTCVTYLSFDAFGSGMCENDPEFEQRLLSYPLYDYASRYWGIHTYLVSDYQFCFAFLTMTSKVSACSQALLAVKRWPSETSYSQRVPLQMNGLHLAAFFGLREAVRKIDSKATGERGRGETPLHYAAKNGHEAVVRLLLKSGVEIDSKAMGELGRGETPLHYAAENGHEAVVRLLLDNGAEIDLGGTGKWGETPLHYAAENGHEAVMRTVDRCYWRHQPRDHGSIIPKSVLRLNRRVSMEPYAVNNGQEAVARLLREKAAR